MTCDLKFVCVRAEEHYIFRMPDLHWILVLLDACLPKAWTPPKCCVSHWWLVPRLGKSELYTSKVEHVLWNELFLATAFPEVCRCDAVDAPKAFKREWERECLLQDYKTSSLYLVTYLQQFDQNNLLIGLVVLIVIHWHDVPSHFFEAVLDCWLDGCGIDAVGVRRWIRVKTYYPYIYLIDIRRASICWRVLKCLQKWFDLFGCFENCAAWLNPTYTRTQRFGCRNQSVCTCNARPESNSRFARARLALAAHRDWILWRKDVWRIWKQAAWDFSLCSCCSPESRTNTDCCCTYRTWRLTLFSVVLGMNLCVFKLRCQFPAWFEDSFAWLLPITTKVTMRLRNRLV